MVSINPLLALTSFLAHQYAQIQAASLGSDPVAVDPHAPQFLHELRGSPIDRKPVEFRVAKNGQFVVMKGSRVVRQEAMARDAKTGLQNSDLEALASALRTNFSYNANEIKNKWTEGRTEKVGWPGNYWPSVQDGINQVWDPDHPSPAEKYAIATGKNVTEFMDRVSATGGIDYFSSSPICTNDTQCQGDDRCGIRAGRSEGYCMPLWAGICHGWAPAAVLEPEPRCAIDFNGVNFQPVDLKALMTQVYADVKAEVSVRMVGVVVSGNDTDGRTDEYGRFVKLDRRDVGPAAFHIVTANVLGRDRKNFLFDLSANESVWNQPALSYKFNDPVVLEPAVAAQKFFNANDYSVFNPDAEKIHYIETTFQYVEDATANGALVPRVDNEFSGTKIYQYLLELDKNDTIIGGEWVADSKVDHPDVLWVALNQPDGNLDTSLGISYQLVRSLTLLSSTMNC